MFPTRFAAQRQAAQAEMHEQLAEQREAAGELDMELRHARETIAAQEQKITALRDEQALAHENVAAGAHAIEMASKKYAAEMEALKQGHRSLEQKLAATGEALGQMRCRAEVEAERVKTLAADNDRLRTELSQAAKKAEDAAQRVAAAEQKAAVATIKLDGQVELLAIAREQGQQDQRRIGELLSEAKNTHERAHAAVGAAPPSKEKKP